MNSGQFHMARFLLTSAGIGMAPLMAFMVVMESARIRQKQQQGWER